MKRVICELCGFDIDTHQIKRHKKACFGRGPRKYRKKESNGPGLGWSKGKTFEDIYGEKRANEIKNKLRVKGKGRGRCKDPKKEILRRKKIALAMKGNNNGATSFRRRKIIYNDIVFKSGWEVLVAQYFDSNQIQWKYENITYDLSETTSYTPDFSIYENNIFLTHIEVKGYFRKENRIKFREFLNLYPHVEIEIWNKKQLVERKII